MAETMRCPRCGSDNSFEASFCSDCGASLSRAATGSTTRLDRQVCSNCQTQNPENVQFCSKCGHQLGTPAAPRPQPYARPNVRQQSGEHSMNCPVCQDVTLVMTDRQGIEVDYCPKCRGVWLDRGELDKIIERVGHTQASTTAYPAQRSDYGSPKFREHRDDDDNNYRGNKKRRGLLDELFDFG